ncbi:hypothetical protein ACMFMG_010815 [Clarireedia jacksonii]
MIFLLHLIKAAPPPSSYPFPPTLLHTTLFYRKTTNPSLSNLFHPFRTSTDPLGEVPHVSYTWYPQPARSPLDDFCQGSPTEPPSVRLSSTTQQQEVIHHIHHH